MRLGARKATLASGLVLAGSLAMLLSACGTTGNTKAPDSKQILHLQDTAGTDIATFDPALVTDLYSAQYVNVVFPGLIVLDKNLKPEAWAASALPTVSTDGLTWTIHIRPGLKWSDGTPIDAADYAFSINRTENPCIASPTSYYLYALKDAQAFNGETCDSKTNTITGKIQTLIGDSVTVVDASTLQLTLAAPASYFLDALTYPTSYAVPQSLVNQYGSTWINHLPDNGGFGGDMFKVTQWDHVHDLILTRNDNFWGTKPTLKTVDVKFYKDTQTAYNAFRAGQSDVGSAPVADLAVAKKDKTFKQIGTQDIGYIGLNWAVAPFTNLAARQAFDLAIDKDTIATSILKGTVAASNHIVPSGMPGYNPNLQAPDGTTSTAGNPTKAAQLLATYCGTVTDFSACPPVTLTITTGSQTLINETDAIQGMWTKAFPGYKITITSITFNALIKALYGDKNTLQAWTIGWIEDYPDPQDWLSLNLECGNYASVCDQQADALMKAADVNLNQTQRLQQYQQAEQILVTEVGWLTIDQATTWWETGPHLQGFSVGAGGLTPRESWQAMYITA